MKPYFLLAVLICMTVFSAIPDVPDDQAVYIDFFLLSDQLLTAQTYVYFIFTHVVLIMLSYMLWHEATDHHEVFRAFCWIQIFYLIQYLLHYNAVWFYIGEIGLSSHVVTVLFLAYVIYEE